MSQTFKTFYIVISARKLYEPENGHFRCRFVLQVLKATVVHFLLSL